MTRRIAFAILTIVWLSLLTAGVSTYFITRSLLLQDLDETILNRVASLPELERPASMRRATPDMRDRFVIKNPQGQVIASPSVATTGIPAPIILEQYFSTLDDGTRQRTLKLQAFAKRAGPNDPLTQVTVIYSAPADHVDALLTRLLYSLIGLGLFAAVATAAVAKAVADVALLPLRDTAEVIGTIDEKSLDRRIDVGRLPTELAPVGTKLNDLLARLERAFSQRRQFLADASHELRTPVAGLVTTLEVALRRRREPEEYVRTLESCLSDARLLNQLIVALLDQVRLERFADVLELAPVAISAVLNQCADLGMALATPKRIRVERDIPHNLAVISDEAKIRSVINNLISNAVEYTEEGGHIWLTVRTEALKGEQVPSAISAVVQEGVTAIPRQLVIRVMDDGPGIAAEHLPNLFEPFYRADTARSNAEHHLGLGLAVVQSSVRALGGDCEVQSPRSSELRGCEFRVLLPTLEISAGSIVQAQNAPEEATECQRLERRENVQIR